MKYTTFNSEDKFGILTIIERCENHIQPSGQVKARYTCKCECGNIVKVQKYHLKSGHTKSCGCKVVETSREAGRKYKTHGHWVNNKPTPEWTTWRAIKNRCYNKNHKDYKYWGAKGVIVCERWLLSFENFYSDMGDRPTNKHSIDRINPFGNYEPSNCRWATSKEQANNKRKNYEVHNF